MKVQILILSLFFCVTIKAQNNDCVKFKNGTFYYPSMPDKISKRTGTIQKSYSNEKLEATWSVKWITDCEYDLVCVEVLDDASNFIVGTKIHVEIVSSVKNCYYSMLTIYNNDFPNGYSVPGGPFPLCRKE